MRTLQERSLLAVIIPTLNAAAELPATLAAIASTPIIGEIIVVDGGSRDETVALAHAAGTRVITAPSGRGPQLAAGAAAATPADWLFFLHADCRPGSGWEAAIADFVASPGTSRRAAYFALALDDDHPAARLLEQLVRWRCRLFALPYGDQGLLISRALYESIGGFAPLPLMEDVDLVHRLGRARLAPLPATMTASAKRYQSGGYIRRPLRNLLCLAMYYAGVSPRVIARLYG